MFITLRDIFMTSSLFLRVIFTAFYLFPSLPRSTPLFIFLYLLISKFRFRYKRSWSSSSLHCAVPIVSIHCSQFSEWVSSVTWNLSDAFDGTKNVRTIVFQWKFGNQNPRHLWWNSDKNHSIFRTFYSFIQSAVSTRQRGVKVIRTRTTSELNLHLHQMNFI